MDNKVSTVGEFIEELRKFSPDRLIIVDLDGNTDGVPRPKLWNENDPESPVALFIDEL